MNQFCIIFTISGQLCTKIADIRRHDSRLSKMDFRAGQRSQTQLEDAGFASCIVKP